MSSAITLSERLILSMFMSKLKLVLAVVLVSGVIVSGINTLRGRRAGCLSRRTRLELKGRRPRRRRPILSPSVPTPRPGLMSPRN